MIPDLEFRRLKETQRQAQTYQKKIEELERTIKDLQSNHRTNPLTQTGSGTDQDLDFNIPTAVDRQTMQPPVYASPAVLQETVGKPKLVSLAAQDILSGSPEVVQSTSAGSKKTKAHDAPAEKSGQTRKKKERPWWAF